MPKLSPVRRIQLLSVLLEPTRWRLYRRVASRSEAVTRDEAADALGISRAAAAFHLDRLVAAGLLRAYFRRLGGRSGPAAGRPSKLYRRSRRRFEVAIPPRQHPLMSRLLAEATARSADAGTVDAVGHEFGRSLGVRARARLARGADANLSACVEAVTADLGFEPTRTNQGELWARNCPFDPVSRSHPMVVCQTALAIVRGVIDGIEAPGIQVRRDERPGWCCVIQGPASALGDVTIRGNKTASRVR